MGRFQLEPQASKQLRWRSRSGTQPPRVISGSCCYTEPTGAGGGEPGMEPRLTEVLSFWELATLACFATKTNQLPDKYQSDLSMSLDAPSVLDELHTWQNVNTRFNKNHFVAAGDHKTRVFTPVCFEWKTNHVVRRIKLKDHSVPLLRASAATGLHTNSQLYHRLLFLPGAPRRSKIHSSDHVTTWKHLIICSELFASCYIVLFLPITSAVCVVYGAFQTDYFQKVMYFCGNGTLSWEVL